ncbi:MAG: hypothetical protein HY810_06375 [Candidatus Omnitrophica bacterium]|nr:hypothetical protein [Candidatus Omnitrophota bacterium]
MANSRFFNIFFVLLFPDKVFKKIIKDIPVFDVLISLLLFVLLISGWIFKGIDITDFLDITISPAKIILIILAVFFLLIMLIALISVFLDWLYSVGLRVKGQRLCSDFIGSFLCHAQVIPLWFFLGIYFFIHPHMKIHSLSMIGGIIFIARLLDIEARLLKAVYNLRMIQAYLVVFMTVLLILLGGMIGNFLNQALILYKQR